MHRRRDAIVCTHGAGVLCKYLPLSSDVCAAEAAHNWSNSKRKATCNLGGTVICDRLRNCRNHCPAIPCADGLQAQFQPV